MKTPITLFADFNNTDKDGRVRLNVTGTFNDIAANGIVLEPGLTVILDDNDELKTIGIVEFSYSENIWVAIIDWDNIM